MKIYFPRFGTADLLKAVLIVLNVEVDSTVPSYYLESTASRPISEVKPGQAVLVLWWETTRESAVRYGFFLFYFFLFGGKKKGTRPKKSGEAGDRSRDLMIAN